MASEYYMENFESYSELFKNHVIHVSELMKIMDDEIISMGLPPVGRTKDLFRMLFDLMYHVDKCYEKAHNIEDEDRYSLTTYMSKGDVLDAMRSTFKDEFARYMDELNGKAE